MGRAKMNLLLWLNAKIEVDLFEVSKIMCCALCKGMGFLWMCGSIFVFQDSAHDWGCLCQALISTLQIHHYFAVTLPIL